MGQEISKIPCCDQIFMMLSSKYKAERERKCMLLNGEDFKKRNFTFGWNTSLQDVNLSINDDGDELLWGLTNQSSNSSNSNNNNVNRIENSSLKSIESKGTKSIVFVSKTGDILLEVEHNDKGIRDKWVLGLSEVLLHQSQITEHEKNVATKTAQKLKEKAEKAIYFQKKDIELQQKRKAAEDRKSAHMAKTGGLKYTALAMANRE